MIAVVLDTNIFVSAIRFRGRPLELVLLGVDRQIDIALSQAHRRGNPSSSARQVHSNASRTGDRTTVMNACGRRVEATIKLDVVNEDPNDNHIVECAVPAGADFIITGDRDLLRMSDYQGIAILRVGEFLGRRR